MFNRKTRRHLDASSIIGQKTRVEGNVTFEGRLHVNGTIRGNVSATGDDRAMLTLSETGSIEGDVHVPHIILNGPVTGSVHASDHIELASKARVEGDVHYALIEMAMGAEVNGKLVRMLAREPAAIRIEAPLTVPDEPE